MEASAIDNIPLVKRHLPIEGLDAFLDRPWHSVVNAFNHAHAHPQAPDSFPLEAVVMAPNSPRFLASLGRPLAIAHELESSPGIWWLATPCGSFDYVIFSDCHRKNAWKGGQICMAHSDLEKFTPQHPGLVALCRGFEKVWGRPPHSANGEEPGFAFETLKWFDSNTPHMTSWPKEGSPTFSATQALNPVSGAPLFKPNSRR